MYYTASRESLQGVFAKKRNNLSVNASHCHCPGCGTQRLLRCRLHPAGRGPNSSSLFPPLAAVVAVAPTEGRPWHSPQSERFRQRLPYQGSWRAQARLRGWTKDGLTVRLLLDSTSPSLLRNATARVAAPSVCFAVACILLAAAPTAPPCFRHWRRSSPLLLPRGGLGIPQSFASSLEAPPLGELARSAREGSTLFPLPFCYPEKRGWGLCGQSSISMCCFW